MSPTPIISRFPRLILIAVAAIMLLPGLDSLPLIDRDEPRFSHATVEMMYRSEWIVPYFNDEYRFDKPPLTYWWMRVHFWVFGINEFSARLHSTIASLLGALLIFGFARRLGCDHLRAFLAGAGWLTCLQVLVHSRMSVADMPLILFLILTMRALWELQNRDPDRPFSRCFSDPWFYALGLSMGMGFLAKGPLAQFIPLLAILLWALFNRIQKRGSPNFARLLLYFLASAPIWLGMMAAWGIPALLATRGEFYDEGIGYHVVERGSSAFNDRFFIPGIYYFIVVVPFLLPWSARIPEVFRTAWRDPEQGQKGTFLLGWLLSPFVIFSFYATQLPHYVLPGYPAFFLILLLASKERARGRFAKAIACISLALPLGGLVFFLLCFALIPADAEIAVLRPLMLFAVAGVAVIALAVRLVLKGNYLGVVLVGMLGALLLVPATRMLRETHVTLRLRKALADRKFDHRISWKFTEPSLVWYFDDGTGEGFRWERWGADWERPEHNNIVMVLENRRWRIDGKTVAAIARREQEIPPTKNRPESEGYRNALAMLLEGGGKWEEIRVVGWSPATTNWVELVAFVPVEDSE